MKICHNEVRTETCGRTMYVHVHRPTAGKVGDTLVKIEHPNNGRWYYCLHCDTDNKGCSSCEDAIPAATPA